MSTRTWNDRAGLATGFSRAFLVAAGIMRFALVITIVAIRVRRAEPRPHQLNTNPNRPIVGSKQSLTHGATMKLTIIAATGGVGQQLLEQALDAGHDVTAVVRNPAKLSRKVHAVTTDMTGPDPAALASATAGADAVLSGLGPHSNADAGIAQRGTRAILEAMQATGVRRIVVVSAGPVSTVASPGRPNPPKHDPGDGFFMRYLFSKIASARFGKVYVDLAQMEDLVADSGLDWTVVRPQQMTDKPLTGTYRTAYGQNIRGGWTVPRADVAHFMLRVLDQPKTIHQVIGIGR